MFEGMALGNVDGKGHFEFSFENAFSVQNIFL